MSADRRHGTRKPLDQSTRTDQQRLNPHINAISGESSGFCNETFNAWSRLLLRDVKNLQVGIVRRRNSNAFATSRFLLALARRAPDLDQVWVKRAKPQSPTGEPRPTFITSFPARGLIMKPRIP